MQEGVVVSYKNSVGNSRKLPNVPVSAGLNTYFMIWISYLSYHPKLTYHLFIYSNPFLKNSHGTRVMGSTRRMHKIRRTFQKQYIYWQDIPFQTF